ncbi:MAG: DUF4040 domain-containing protein [Cyanobacteria bacterium]|nr:DUF4040 domain-containing protein [Cyanobacteria bacterium bin.51]
MITGLGLLVPITALLPLTAILLVNQRSPYQTLVLRGILGAIATLVYALLGAADVALTEALVGTLLSTTLYAIALRSSMVFRLELKAGVELAPERRELLERWLQQAFLRLEVIAPAKNAQAASLAKEKPGLTEPAGLPVHGWLLSADQLSIASPWLSNQLQGLAGAQVWQRAGGLIATGAGVANG